MQASKRHDRPRPESGDPDPRAELRAALARLIDAEPNEDIDWSVVEHFQQFRQLSPRTRAWLASQSPSDLKSLDQLKGINPEKLKELLVYWDRVLTISWFLRWTIGGCIALFIGAVAFGKSIGEALTLIGKWLGRG